MKSSMHNQLMYPQQVIKADKRIEALMKLEMREHEHLISSHNKEMQSLRDEFRLSKEKCESIVNRCEQELKDFKTYAISMIGTLRVKLESNEMVIAEQKKSIQDLHMQLLNFQDSYYTCNEIDVMKKIIDGNLTTTTMNHIVLLQDFQREMKELINSLVKELLNLKTDVENKFLETKEKCENNCNTNRLDKEGIERELIRYKKSVFYIEKKIENLYTLIERINKRNDKCLMEKNNS